MTNQTHQLTPKVLIAADNGHITEVEMIKGLRERGVDIHAAFASTSPHLKDLEAAGVPIRTLDLKTNADLRSALKIRKWIKEGQFNIVHGLANRQVANFIWASYRMPNKVIAYRGAIGHISRWDPTCYLKWLNPRIDKIVCVSNAVKEDLKEHGINANKLTTIYKGHDLKWYNTKRKSIKRQELNRVFKIPPESILVGSAGNLRRVKGADVIINALHYLPENIHAVFIGEIRDSLLQQLASHPDVSDRVHFTGFRKDAVELIGSLDINTAPSRGREGLTKTVIEGMAQCIPSITSKAGGLAETIEHGISGYHTEENTPKEFAKLINILAQDYKLRDRIGTKARERVETHFNIQETIKKTERLYKELSE